MPHTDRSSAGILIIDVILSLHTEAVLGESEISSKPYIDGRQKDDGTCVLDEGPATLARGVQYGTFVRRSA
jgi:hypothetical protein